MYFSNTDTVTRRTKLSENFGFDCTCPACVTDDYPTFENQTFKDVKLLHKTLAYELHLNDFNARQLRGKYASLIKLLQQNSLNFPSRELSLLQMYAIKTLEHTSRPAHTFQ